MSFPLIAGAGARPVVSSEDVIKLIPKWMMESEAAPIRDALIAALTEMLLCYEQRSEIAIAQVDPFRAVRQYLAALARDEGTIPAVGEDDEDLRERMLTNSGVTTELAITTGVNLLLAPFTSEECQLIDCLLDQWFVREESVQLDLTAWNSFGDRQPRYLDRLLLDEAAENGGYVRPNAQPWGLHVFALEPSGNQKGRAFLLRVPWLFVFDSSMAFVYPAPPASPDPGVAASHALHETGAWWTASPTDPTAQQGGFMYDSATSALTLYRAIVAFVDRIVGQSIRWSMYSEPTV